MLELSLSCDAQLEPASGRRCPYDGRWAAAAVGQEWSDPEADELPEIELTRWRCAVGHEWTEPSRRQILYSIAYGPNWVERLSR